MKFGQVENPDEVDFTIPPDHPDTKRILAKSKKQDFKLYVGCAKWNKKDLKNFYPKGIKDELGYYASHFNCVELNATFYKRYWEKQYTAWRDGVPEGFLFFPKLPQGITHFSRLKNVEEKVDQFAENSAFLNEKLGMPFLQMHNNFRSERFRTCRGIRRLLETVRQTDRYGVSKDELVHRSGSFDAALRIVGEQRHHQCSCRHRRTPRSDAYASDHTDAVRALGRCESLLGQRPA